MRTYLTNCHNGCWEPLQHRAPPPGGVLVSLGVRHPGNWPRLSLQERKVVEGLQTYILHHVSHDAPSALPFAFELRGLPTDHVPASGRKTDVERASAVRGADVTMDPGASRTPFIELPVPLPTAGPTHRPPFKQHLLTLTTQSFPPDHPLVLPALPRTNVVAGDAGQDLDGSGACNIIDQVRSEVEQPQCPQTQTTVLTQAPIHGSAPGAISGGVGPAPLILEASAVERIMPASAFGNTQAGKKGWCPGLPPPAPPAAAQLAPIIPPVNAGPWPHRASREGGLATSQPKASPDDSCNPNILYRDFRHWQLFKALARGPVLRSLSRLKPTMTLEEGIGQAVQEWQRTSNFDRMTYYDMAAKFMEFEAEEHMQLHKLQLVKGAQGQPPPAPPRPDPQGGPAPVVGPQPANTPSTQCAHPLQPPEETESPNGIPPEAVQEYMDTMDYLEGLAHSASGEPGGERKEDTKEWYEEEGFLSYLDELCSQNDFVTQLEEVIHPLFIARALSPVADMDLLDLAEKMEQEEGVSPAQLVEERLLASEKTEGVQASPSHGAALWDSSPSQSVAGHDAQSCDLGPQVGGSEKASPPETDFKDRQRPHLTDAHLLHSGADWRPIAASSVGESKSTGYEGSCRDLHWRLWRTLG
ncbi:NUT family member 2G-like [Molossus nigricans]